MSPRFLLLGRHHAGTGLIALQLAIGAMLCVQAWHAITALQAARTAPDGIAATGLLLVPWIRATPATDPGTADVLRRLRDVPGVRSATAANQAPYGNTAWNMQAWTSAQPASRPRISVFLGDAHFGETLDIATTRGRGFLRNEFHDYAGDQTVLHAGTRPAILSSALARRLFGDTDPLDRTLQTAPGAYLRVVGVIDRLPPPAVAHGTDGMAVLLPLRMARAGEAQFVVRHAGDTDAMARRIHAALSRAYPSSAVAMPIDMATLREASLHEPRRRARWSLIICAGWWLLTLGTLTLGGHRWVQVHAQEFSLRRAVGASGAQLARRVRLEYLLLAVIACLAGLACAAWLLPRCMPAWSTNAIPAWVHAIVAIAGIAAVQLAAGGPARAARRIPPHLVSRSPSVRL